MAEFGAYIAGIVNSLKVEPTGENARPLLIEHSWTKGLQDKFILALKKLPLRFFICDDSGSMLSSDGNRLKKEENGEIRLEKCTRWEELLNTTNFHISLSRLASAPSSFRLLNQATKFLVGCNDVEDAESIDKFINTAANGRTPLCETIAAVIQEIRIVEDQLREAGKLASLIILTDGEPTDGDFLEALKPLADLPVWIVIRLCTNDEKVVQYWNEIDSTIEFNIEVLADLNEEAVEVFTRNSWLTYSEPFHRLREFGISLKEMDMLDEVPLSLEQIALICSIIFGDDVHDYPHPEAQWDAFLARIQTENAKYTVWSPLHNDFRPYINIEELTKLGPSR